MNCTQIRRFLYAFADGELGVKDNCEVLDHLKMCPACARIVDDQQALRRAIGGSLASEPIPEQLVQRVQASLRGHSAGPVWARIGPRMWAAAAALLLVVGVGGYRWWSEAAPATPSGPAIPVVQVADGVVATHLACCQHTRSEHQSRQLPQTLEGLRDSVEERFGARMEVLVPDFSGAGFAFDSANVCGVEDNKPGLHIIYRRGADDTALSFFSVPRCSLHCCKGFCNRGKRSFYLDARTENGVRYAIAGWYCPKGRSSFLACASLAEDDLLNVLETVRMVRGGDPPAERALTVAACMPTPIPPDLAIFTSSRAR